MELEHKALISKIFRQPLANDITQARLTAVTTGNKLRTTWKVAGKVKFKGIVNAGPQAGHTFSGTLTLKGTSRVFG